MDQICVLKWTESQICRVKYLGNDRVYFLDYGSESELELDAILVPISKKCLEMLPFQAIRCTLANIKPNEGKKKK